MYHIIAPVPLKSFLNEFSVRSSYFKYLVNNSTETVSINSTKNQFVDHAFTFD